MAISLLYNRQVASGYVPDSSGVLPNPADTKDFEGRVRNLYAKVTYEEADAAATAVEVAILPLGARVLSAFFNVQNALAAGNTTLGDAGDADRYIVAVSTASIGIVGTIAQPGLGFEVDTEANRTVLLTAAADPVAGDEIDVHMTYVVD